MKVIGTLLIILALVAAVVPQFTDCESQGKAIALPNGKTVSMKCHWTAEASTATAVPLALMGGLVIFSKRKETLRALSILGLAFGAFLILLPTALIGVCASPEMICNAVMKPTLILSGILTMVLSAAILVLAGRGEANITGSQPA
jgi:hypothetical protein